MLLAALASTAQAQPCAICSGSGKVDNLWLRYNGTSSPTVEFRVRNPEAGTIFGPTTVQPGDLIVLERPGNSKGIGNNVEIIVGGTKIHEFHTSCSKVIDVGDVFGNGTYPFEVIGGGSQGNPNACGIADLACASTPDLPVDEASPGPGDVVTLTPSFTNDGSDSATGVEVTVSYDAAKLQCPSGDCMATGGDSQDDSTPGTIVFDLGTLAAGATEALSFKLEVTATATGSSRVDATVTASGGPDLDSTPGSLTLPIPQDDECTVTFSNLPVELVSFEAQVDGRSALLRWETASETNNAGFEVQHRYVDPANKSSSSFQALAWIEGHGTTLEPHAYSFQAEGLDPGRHVFRLKQIDFDGAFEYSPEVEIAIEMPEAFILSTIYPNPFNPQASFSLGVQREQGVAVEVYNMLGQQVLELYRGVLPAGITRTLTIEGSDLVSGTYVLRVTGETFVETQTFTVIK